MSKMPISHSLAWILIFGSNLIAGFYLPGLAPVNYCMKGKESDVCKVSLNLSNLLSLLLILMLSNRILSPSMSTD